MKKPLLIFALACFVALSSIVCGSLCGNTHGDSVSVNETADNI